MQKVKNEVPCQQVTKKAKMTSCHFFMQLPGQLNFSITTLKNSHTAGRLTTCHWPEAGWLLLLLKIKWIWSHSQPFDNLSPACSWLAACTLEN